MSEIVGGFRIQGVIAGSSSPRTKNYTLGCMQCGREVLHLWRKGRGRCAPLVCRGCALNAGINAIYRGQAERGAKGVAPALAIL